MSSLLFSPTCLSPIQGLVDFVTEVKPFRTKIFETGVMISVDDAIRTKVIETVNVLVESKFNYHQGLCEFPEPACIVQGFEHNLFDDSGFEPSHAFEILPTHSQQDIIVNEPIQLVQNGVGTYARDVHGNVLYRQYVLCSDPVDISLCADELTTVETRLTLRRLYTTNQGLIRFTVVPPNTLRTFDLISIPRIELSNLVRDLMNQQTQSPLELTQLEQMLTQPETSFVARRVEPDFASPDSWFGFTYEILSYEMAVASGFVGTYSRWLASIQQIYGGAVSAARIVQQLSALRVSTDQMFDLSVSNAVSQFTIHEGALEIHFKSLPQGLYSGMQLKLIKFGNFSISLEFEQSLVDNILYVQQVVGSRFVIVNQNGIPIPIVDLGITQTIVDQVNKSLTVLDATVNSLSCSSGFEILSYEILGLEDRSDRCCTDLFPNKCTQPQQYFRIEPQATIQNYSYVEVNVGVNVTLAAAPNPQLPTGVYVSDAAGTYVVTDGIVKNNEWNWPAVGVAVYATQQGQLVDYDPMVGGIPQLPVGKILTRTEVLVTVPDSICIADMALFNNSTAGGIIVYAERLLRTRCMPTALFSNQGLSTFAPTTAKTVIGENLTIIDDVGTVLM